MPIWPVWGLQRPCKKEAKSTKSPYLFTMLRRLRIRFVSLSTVDVKDFSEYIWLQKNWFSTDSLWNSTTVIISTYIYYAISSHQTVNHDQKCGNHKEICAIPVSIPINFHNPFPEIQIKTDPNANRECCYSKDCGKYIEYHHCPFIGIDRLFQVIRVIVIKVIPHFSTLM